MKEKLTYLDLNNPMLEDEQVTTANLGALYIISALEKEGYEIDYRDYQVSPYASSLKVKNILDFAKDSSSVVMICCMAYMLPLVVLAVQEIKRKEPEKLILLGGVGATGVGNELCAAFPEFDVIMKGEGEQTIVEVLHALEQPISLRDESLSRVNGIVFRNQQNEVVITNERIRNCQLDEILFPAYNKIVINNYKEFGLVTGRGCAYKCSFCDIHGLWGDKYLQRSLDNVMQELNLLVKEFGVKSIRIWDDTFTMSEKRILEFCKRIRHEKLEFQWTCFGRVNLVNEKLLEEMAKAGCIGMFFGLESGSERILKRIDKKITVPQMVKAVQLTKKYMKTKGHFIWGFPFETCEELYQTIYLNNYLSEFMEVSIGQLWPYPKSPLYNEFKHITRFNEELDMFHKILPFKEDEHDERQKVKQLIIEHKDIFTQFYYYHTDNFMERYEMIKRLEFII